jgi:dolichol-phosphate mannosyltransferase
VVPAFNAAPTVPGVVAGLHASLPGAFVVVIDDGSTDGTTEAVHGLADATVRFHENRGKGAALRVGLARALERGCQSIVTIDADGQHDPRDAPRLLDALGAADLAVGARRRVPGGMPLGRRITNRLSAAAVARCVGQPVADAQSGFRAMRADVAATVKPAGARYEFETEFLIGAARRGYRIAYVSIPTSYPHIIPSRFRTVRDSARIIETIWRLRRPGAGV